MSNTTSTSTSTKADIQATPKNYLIYENERNRIHHTVQEELVKRAFGKEAEVLVAHHITYELPNQDPIEIPSADTLIFDYDIMRKVFGNDAKPVMHDLIQVDCGNREDVLKQALSKLSPL